MKKVTTAEEDCRKTSLNDDALRLLRIALALRAMIPEGEVGPETKAHALIDIIRDESRAMKSK